MDIKKATPDILGDSYLPVFSLFGNIPCIIFTLAKNRGTIQGQSKSFSFRSSFPTSRFVQGKLRRESSGGVKMAGFSSQAFRLKSSG
jgi:hypothetical protein